MLRAKTDRYFAAKVKALTDQLCELQPNDEPTTAAKEAGIAALMLANKHRMQYEVYDKRGDREAAVKSLRAFRKVLQWADHLTIATFLLQEGRI